MESVYDAVPLLLATLATYVLSRSGLTPRNTCWIAIFISWTSEVELW